MPETKRIDHSEFLFEVWEKAVIKATYCLDSKNSHRGKKCEKLTEKISSKEIQVN